MPRGSKPGERRGGRKKGKPNKRTQELRDIIEKAISTQERMELLAELARGVTVREVKKNGDEVIYDKPPDSWAIKQLNEYQHGKPKEFHEISSNEFKVVFEHIAIK